MKVTVIGTGYVGLVTGACLGYIGHRVTCVDSNEDKISTLRNGSVPFYEPHLKELIELAQTKGTIEFTSGIHDAVRDADVIFIAVGTPSLPSGASDLRYLEAAAQDIGAAMDSNRRRIVVNKSTVPIGSGNLVERLVRDGAVSGKDVRFSVASNPEFLREGSAISDSLYPDRIVVGADTRDVAASLEELYRPLLDQSFDPPPFLARPAGMRSVAVVSTTLISAEMIKYAANAFLAMKISFANEMANICERVGADVRDVTCGIGFDSRIGNRFLNAGIGWGGSCFGKDIQSLAHTAAEYGYRPALLEATQEVNQRQRQIVIQKLQEKLLVLKGRTVGLLGLAFKPDTDDLRDAPSLTIAKRLVEMGVRVRAYDPVAMKACLRQFPELAIQYCDHAEALADGSDALVVVTEWDEFRRLDWKALGARMNRRILVDGRNLVPSEVARSAGFDYAGIGTRVLPEMRNDALAWSPAAVPLTASIEFPSRP